jgi:hypothetical protein
LIRLEGEQKLAWYAVDERQVVAVSARSAAHVEGMLSERGA